MRRSIAKGALLVVVAFGCAAPEITTPSPDATASLWGPLAVFSGGPVMQTPGLEGTLELTHACVFVRASDANRYLVAWPVAPDLWQWDAASQEIVSYRNGQVSRYGDGSHIIVGGGGSSKGGPSVDAMLAGIDWVVPPRPECPFPPIWVANGEFIER